MKLIIAGARDLFMTADLINFFVRGFRLTPKMVFSGGASGIDRAGEYWANQQGIPIKKFIPDWDAQGKAAGPIRNRAMSELADALLLIWRGDSKGSGNMREEMEKLGKPIYEVILKSSVKEL